MKCLCVKKEKGMWVEVGEVYDIDLRHKVFFLNTAYLPIDIIAKKSIATADQLRLKYSEWGEYPLWYFQEDWRQDFEEL